MSILGFFRRLASTHALLHSSARRHDACKPATKARLSVEQLERREVLTASANLNTATGLLTITGSDQPDQISIVEYPVADGGAAQLQVVGVTSATVDNRPAGPFFPSALVRKLSVDLKGSDDRFTLMRSALVFDPARLTLQNNPAYNALTSGTIHGGSGNDRIDVAAANPATFTLLGEGDNDTLIGGAGNDTLDGGPGNDILVGGNGSDTLQGKGGDDKLYGAAIGDYNYQDGFNDMHGGAGNDALFGGNGGNLQYGDEGNDALYGGRGSVRSILYGGAGADRFLVRDERFSPIQGAGLDFTVDRAGADALIHVQAGPQDPTNQPLGPYSFWKDSEIENVDDGFAKLVARTNNTTLLKLVDGREVTLQRVGTIPASTPKSTVLADNDSRGLIRFTDAGVEPANAPDQTLVHEIGHNWDAESGLLGSYWVVWQSLSGWEPATVLALARTLGNGKSLSTDGRWLHDTGAKFSRSDDYGKTNPYEDWSTSWEAYFYPKAASSTPVAAKNALLDLFFSAISS